MTEDAFPPPDPLAPPEEEELEAANALRQALEGRPGGSRVPEEALETAAFLRHAGDGGRLSRERRAELRAELLASLPAVPARPRKSWKSWLGIGVTLLGAASAAVTVGVLGVREWGTQDRAGQALSEARETAARDSSGKKTSTYGDEGSAAQQAASPGLAPAPELASAPSPALAVRSAGEPGVAQRAIGGLTQGEQEAPPGLAAERSRLSASNASSSRASSSSSSSSKTSASANAASGGSAPASGSAASAAPSKLARRAEAAGAWDRAAAPADEDDARALEAGSRGAPESKGRGAGAAAPAAGPAPQLAGTEARVERKRQAQRSQLLARLGNTPAPDAYRDADRARSVPELERARQRLTALSSAGLGGTSSAAEAEQLRPDVYCRLAEIALRLAQPRAALDWAQQGLALGTEPSPFVACLYQQQGRAREALGDRDGAAHSYMDALKVNERLLNESLEAP